MNTKRFRRKGYYFLKHGMFFLILFLVLGFAALHFWYYASYKNFEHESLNGFYYFKENMEETLSDASFESKRAMAECFLQNGYSWEANALAVSSHISKSYVFDDATGKIVCGNEDLNKTGYMFSVLDKTMSVEFNRSASGSSKRIKNAYYCDKEELKEYLTEAKQRKDYWEEHLPEMEGIYDHLEIRSRLDAFYYHNCYFIPAKVSLFCVQVKNRSGLTGEWKLLEQVDLKIPKQENYT